MNWRGCPVLMPSMKLALLLVSLLGSCLLGSDLPRADCAPGAVPGPAAPQTSVTEPEVPQSATPREDSDEAAGIDASQALVPGGMVRLKTTLPPGSLKGTIKCLDDTLLTVVVKGGGELILPWSSIQQIDVQVGVRHQYGKWALIGGGIGAFFGLFVPNHQECFAPGCPEDEMFRRNQAVVIGGVLGALTGLLVEGTSQPSAPKWERVPPVPRPPNQPGSGTSIGFGVTQNREGPTVQLVLSF